MEGKLGAAELSFRDPYGAVLFRTGAGTQAGLFGYTGEPELPDGNVFLRARTYSPEIARFLQRDTFRGDFEEPLSWNRYAYVGGDPIQRTDPSGMVWNTQKLSPLELQRQLKTELAIYHQRLRINLNDPIIQELLGHVRREVVAPSFDRSRR